MAFVILLGGRWVKEKEKDVGVMVCVVYGHGEVGSRG